jgi:hypothetical protein
MIPLEKVIYTGVFLSPESKKILLEKIPPSYSKIFAHHLTIKYRPSVEEIKSLSIGKKVTLKITGITEDDKCQAVVVKTDLSSNEFPHITISTLEGTQPVYSNELIKKGGVKEISSFTIEGVIGVSDGEKEYFEIENKHQKQIKEIILPSSLQTDTLIAIFILKKYGNTKNLNLNADFSISISPLLKEGETWESLEKQGIITIDVGGGPFDHHGDKITATKLVSEYLGVSKDASLSKLLALAERDDFYGKGTLSEDLLDKTFGFPSTIGNLNRFYYQNPKKVFETMFPILEAHYKDEHMREVEMPELVEKLKNEGKLKILKGIDGARKISVVLYSSDNPGLSGYLRSYKGGKYDITVQFASTGHTNIITTRHGSKIDLHSFVRLVRYSEFFLKGVTESNKQLLEKEGRIDEVPEWYYDTATNSLLNGGLNPGSTRATSISKDDFEKIVRVVFKVK